jgi:uncharacterized membrane protein YraQ (UPF0718 family)
MKEEKVAPKLGGRWKFLLLMLGTYLTVGWLDPALAIVALTGFKGMFLKVLPILGLVFAALLLVNLLLNPERIRKHLGREAGLKGWFYAVLGGILISGPPYVLYPMLGEFKKHGVGNELLAVFLYNRNVKIPFLPVMSYYFGLRYTIIVSLLIILFSVLNGLLVGKLVK